LRSEAALKKDDAVNVHETRPEGQLETVDLAAADEALSALHAAGTPLTVIADRLGTTPDELGRVLREEATASAALAARLRHVIVFEELPPPARERAASTQVAEPTHDGAPAGDAPVAPSPEAELVLKLAAEGARFHPLRPNDKRPAWTGWPERAVSDREAIAAWLRDGRNLGWALDCHLVVDVDVRDGKHGEASLAALVAEHGALPDTLTIRTASGGRHYIFATEKPVAGRNGVRPGIDLKAAGGYIVAAGAVLGGKPYIVERGLPMAPAPQWLLELVGEQKPAERVAQDPIPGTWTDATRAAVIRYLRDEAVPAVEGQRGDDTTLMVLRRAKDLGVPDVATMRELFTEHYNGRCFPPWDDADIDRLSASAFRNASNQPGSGTAIADFAPAPEFRSFEWYTQQDFGPDEWLVEGLIPAGAVMLIVGRPKVGKGLLAMQLGICVAGGKKLLEAFPCSQRAVLHISFEEDDRMIADRIASLGGGEKSLPIQFALTWPRIGNGGIEALDAYVTKHPECGLVIVDPFAVIREIQGSRGSAYDLDYAAMRPIFEWAKRRKITVVMVHHTRKARSEDDWQDSTNGSTGVIGAVDGVVLLTAQRNSQDGRLRITGRFRMHKDDIPMTKDSDGRWVTKDAQQPRTVQALILEALQAGLTTPSEIAARVDRKRQHVQNTLAEMLARGLVTKVEHGKWKIRAVHSATDIFEE